ncbi:MAG: helix-turn-helix domain-containing protein [Oscillospiraceae bacterium]|nr:helix-turn-helix domain-containing protein [Oscillospiraceae bacterium]
MKKTKRSLREHFAHIPVFWQHFLPMALILTLTILLQILSSARYANIMANTMMEREKETFFLNAEAFRTDIQRVYTVAESLDDAGEYETLRQIADGKVSQMGKRVALTGLQKNLNTSLHLLNLPAEAECLVYFPQADALIARGEVFPNPADCFSAYVSYPDQSPEGMLQDLANTKTTGFRSGATIGETEYLTVVLPPMGTDAVLCVLYPVDAFAQRFHMDALPKTASFLLEDSGGTILSLGKSQGKAMKLSTSLWGAEATLAIPMEYFYSLTASTRNWGLLALCVTLLLGIFLSIGFAKAGASPIRRLLSSYVPSDDAGETRNEIHRLADLLSASREAEQAVEQVLSAGLLSRVFSGGVLTVEEEKRLTEAYAMLTGSCRVAIVHTAEGSEEFGQSGITELLGEHLPDEFAALTANKTETGILFPDTSDALQTLATVLDGVNHQLNMDGLSVQCGVSAPFHGVHSTYAALRQARFSIPIRESSFIEVYSARPDGDDRPGVLSWLTHERLYQSIMKNDRKDTGNFIRILGEDRYYSAAEAKEVFYNVRFVIRSTAGELLLPLPEAESLEYAEELRPKENFAVLAQLADTLFDRMNARQETTAQNALDAVVRYVQENFRNPDLSAMTVANHFSLPLKTVYAAVRDKTELSFNEYLTAVRMKAAARLLCTTAASVDEVGRDCGYPAQSTFYRVFKKFYGESPNRYRSLHLETEENA